MVLGPLAPDFLCVKTGGSNSEAQLEADRQAALALQHETNAAVHHQLASPVKNVPRLSITIAQAKLVKNYGINYTHPTNSAKSTPELPFNVFTGTEKKTTLNQTSAVLAYKLWIVHIFL